MRDVRVVLYDTQWQALRVSLKGDWGDPEGTRSNLARLFTYLEHATEGVEKYYRIYRVINLLNAVRMGHSGQHNLMSEQSLLVAGFRQPLQKYLEQLETGEFKNHEIEWDWEEQRKQLKRLREKDPETFRVIAVDLGLRFRKHGGTHRKELEQYVKLLQEVSHEILM